MKLLAYPVVMLALGATDPEPKVTVTDRDMPLLASTSECGEDLIHVTDDRDVARPQKLGELPTAGMEYAVWATEDGCTVPQVMMERVEP